MYFFWETSYSWFKDTQVRKRQQEHCLQSALSRVGCICNPLLNHLSIQFSSKRMTQPWKLTTRIAWMQALEELECEIDLTINSLRRGKSIKFKFVMFELKKWLHYLASSTWERERDPHFAENKNIGTAGIKSILEWRKLGLVHSFAYLLFK